MNNRYLPIIIFIFLFLGHIKPMSAQNLSMYYNINPSDLRSTECPFEKDANACILSDEEEIQASAGSISITHCVKIKLFKNYPSDLASIHLYYNRNYEKISDISAQTVKWDGTQPRFIALDPKLIYTDKTDSQTKEFFFTFPDVQPGDIIEYKYHWESIIPNNIPAWHFQHKIPTVHSLLKLVSLSNFKYTPSLIGNLPFTINRDDPFTDNNQPSHTWVKDTVPAFVTEPFSSRNSLFPDGIILRIGSRNTSLPGIIFPATTHNWDTMVFAWYLNDDFNAALNQSINLSPQLTEKLKYLNTEQKIKTVFDTVKNAMKWDGYNSWRPGGDIKDAWKKKLGNATDINMILLSMLKKAKIDAKAMFVCTPDYGNIIPQHPETSFINKTVVFVSIDSLHRYVLDASDKYNLFGEVPVDLLNSCGIVCTREYNNSSDIKYSIIYLVNNKPAPNTIYIDAEIGSDGNVSGQTTITSYSYHKAVSSKLHDKLNPTDYLALFKQDNQRLTLSALEVKNKLTDSLPLVQTFKFQLNAGTDNGFIYLHVNLFNPFGANPFISTQRFSNIDFGKNNILRSNARLKLPAQYKTESLPKNIELNSTDNSMRFNRLVEETDGYINLVYNFTNTRATYDVAEYPMVYDFFKQMYTLLNEPIVLKAN